MLTTILIVAGVCIFLGWAAQRFGRELPPSTTVPQKRALLAGLAFAMLMAVMVLMARLIARRG